MQVADRVAAAALEGERVRAKVVEGGEVVDVDGLLVALTNLPTPELNVTVVARAPKDARAALAEAREVFRARGHPFFGIELEVGRHPAVEEAVRAMGLIRVEAWPAMAVAIDGLDGQAVPEDVSIRPVTVEADLKAIHAIEVAVFGAHPRLVERFVGRGMLDDDRIRMFTATTAGEPVGEASAYLLEGTVGIFGVGVVAAARRRGIGAALTVVAARAFEDHADLAWLQPSDMATQLYGRLGFRTVSEWEVWVAR